MARATTTPRRRATADDAALRTALQRLVDAIENELHRRRQEAELEPAGGAPVDIAARSALLRDLPGLARLAARGLRRVAAADPDDVTRLVRGAFDLATAQSRLADRRRHGECTVDDFGFDKEWTESLLPLFAWVYRNWWRVQTEGIENVPHEGRALLVSNHAGVVPYDGAMIRMALLLEAAIPRHARALVLDGLFSLPGASWLVRRTGNTLANLSDAEELLRRDELVLVFPEGAKGTGKPWKERYRLRRFGRGGFVQVALRTRSPIVPVAVVGSEEIHPMIGDVKPVATMLGLPYWPVTPTFPWLGPLGVVPLPTSWMIEFLPPIDLSGYPRDAADDPGAVLEISDLVRDTIQAAVWRNLERRSSVFGIS